MSMSPGGSGSAEMRETRSENLSPTGPATISALASTVRTCVCARAVPWMPAWSILIFVFERVTPWPVGAAVVMAWLSSPSV